MTKLSSLTVLIPCYNDDATVARVIAEARAAGKRAAKRFDITLVDDGSTRPVQSTNARIVRHATNQGYGRTIKELYYLGRNEWLFTIPGDYQIGANEITKLLPHTHDADMILGWRVRRHDPWNRLFTSWVYNALLRLFFGVTIHDANSVRLMRRAIFNTIALTSESAFVDAELIIRAKRAGFRVMEVPIVHRPRADGGAGGGNQWRTILATIIDMIRFLL